MWGSWKTKPLGVIIDYGFSLKDHVAHVRKLKDKASWYHYRLWPLFEGPYGSCEEVERQSLLVPLSIMTSLWRTIWLMWGSWKTKPLGVIIDYGFSLTDHVRQSLLVSLSIMTSLWRTMWLMWGSWKTKPLGAIIDYDLSLKDHVAHVRKLKDKASSCHFRLWSLFEGPCGSCEEVKRQSLLVPLSIMTSLWRTMWLMWGSWKTKPLGVIIDYDFSLKDPVAHVRKLKDTASWCHYRLWPLFEGPCGSCEEVERQSLLVSLSIMTSLWKTMWLMWGSWKTKPLGIIIDYDLSLTDRVAHMRKLKDKASWYHYRLWPLLEGPCGSCEEVERQSLLVSLSIMTSLWRTMWLMWGSWKTKPLGIIIDYDLSLKDHVVHVRKLKDKASWYHYRSWPVFEGPCGSCEEVERQSLLVSLSIMTSLWRTMWLMWGSWKTKPLGVIIDYDFSLKDPVAHVRKLKDTASWCHYRLWPLFEGPCGSCEEVERQSLLVSLSIMTSLWKTMWLMWGSWKTKPLGIIIDYDLSLTDRVAHMRKLKDKASWYHYRLWPLLEGPCG